MGKLHQQMCQDLVIRGLAPKTQQAYTNAVAGLAKYYRRSPDSITEQEVQQYIFYLIKERGLAWNSVNVATNGMRLFFHVTLCQAIGNNILVELENIFWTAYRNAVNTTFPDIAQGAYQVTLGNHYKILAAVEARNVELAQQLMSDHFEGIRKRIEM